MKNTGDKKLRKWQRIVLAVLCVILALLLIGLIFVTAYVENKLNKINRPDASTGTLSPEEIASIEDPSEEPDPDFTGPTIDENDVTWATEPEVVIGNNDNIINILLIGQDRRPGEGRARSDAMILCTVNKSAGTLTMTSFLRDMYVQIPGYRDNRINASYALGGMTLLDECLSVNFGVHVDANIEVDFSQFEQIIDLVGGVDIDLTSREASYLNGNGWSLTSGVNHLNGEQALAYARIRYLDSDFGRTNRQRNVLSALIEKSKTMSLTQINTLLDQILPLITTDMTNAEITGYVMDLFPLLTSLNVTTQYIPANGTYQNASIRGMAVLVPDLEANRQILLDSLGA